MEELFRMMVIRAPEEREPTRVLGLPHPDQGPKVKRSWNEAVKAKQDRILDPRAISDYDELYAILKAGDYAGAKAGVEQHFGFGDDLRRHVRLWQEQRRRLGNGILLSRR